MSTLAEIEAAATALRTCEKRELIVFLQAQLGDAGGEASVSKDLSEFEGTIQLREDPLAYQARVRTEW
jgi:hypothetical protein